MPSGRAALRPEGTNVWYYVPQCKPYKSGPNVIQDVTQDHILCWMLNTTAPYDSNVQATSCNSTFAYVCKKSTGASTGEYDITLYI